MAKKNKVVVATKSAFSAYCSGNSSEHNFHLADVTPRSFGFAADMQQPILKLFCTKCGQVRPL